MPDNYYETKKRWNAANYKQLNLNIKPELYKAFQLSCEQKGISMRKAIIEFMSSYAAVPINTNKLSKKNNRGNRRKTVKNIISQLTKILEDEENYKNNIPENLRNSSRYDAAEQTVETMEAAIDMLNEVFT